MTPQELTAQGFTRRSFMKTSAFTVGAVTFLSGGTALAYSSGDNLWSENFKWSAAGTVEIPGDITDDAADVCEQAMKKRVKGDSSAVPPIPPEPGVKVPGSEVRDPGGTQLDETEYAAVTASITTPSDNPKMTFVPAVPPETQGKWILEFKADFIYKAKYRK